MSDIRFQRLGGSFQLMVKSADDIACIPALNDALWAMTSARTDAFRIDPEFMRMMDTDENGRIRVNEVKAAVKWLLSVLSDYDGITKKSDILRLDAINRNDPDGQEIYQTISVALTNLGVPDSKAISLEQINNQKKIISDALQNGDGIIPPEALPNSTAKQCMCIIMDKIGKRRDAGGVEGIGQEELDSFAEQAKAFVAWYQKGQKESEKILPFGRDTGSLYTSFHKIEEKINSFFRSNEALLLSGKKEINAATTENTLNAMDETAVNTFLQSAPIAPVNGEMVLKLNQIRHPEWRLPILDFFSRLPMDLDNVITFALWQEIKAKMSAYGAWLAEKPETPLSSVDPDILQKILQNDVLDEIQELIDRDKSIGQNLANCSMVKKLLLYQKNMLLFLNNYITLDDLFDESSPSLIQSGRLVMDGRCFTLCMIITDPALHKKIVQNSNICVIYLDAVTGTGAAVRRIKIAVAVTSGNVRHLFIGKSGLFYHADGTVWDAMIFDCIQQPVSISEALVMPFYRFADFMQKQADKFFSARSKQYEDAVAKDIQSQAALPLPAAGGAAAPKPVSPQQTPAFSGSMILMGGGVGIAAIGSAFAFIAKSVQGISVGSVLTVFFGILLIFGGPIVAISLTKLCRRNLSTFFEANGIALNGQMRLSLKMGRFFTYTPRLPGRVKLFTKEIFTMDSMESQTPSKWMKKLLYVLLVILFIECIILLIWYNRDFLTPYWDKFF